jgi:hypothetical protein
VAPEPHTQTNPCPDEHGQDQTHENPVEGLPDHQVSRPFTKNLNNSTQQFHGPWQKGREKKGGYDLPEEEKCDKGYQTRQDAWSDSL